MTSSALRFEVAGPADHDQIFALNYQTFVEEIPQHAPNPTRRLIDRFHEQNTYLIARDGDEIVGMVAMRGERPFSLDEKLGSVDPYLPPHRRACEVRLLAVRSGRRRGLVFAGLMDQILQVGRERGYDISVVSGTTRQLRLYEHMGFVPFGPEVGSGDARYQPMYLTMAEFERHGAPAFRRHGGERSAAAAPPVSFLPGPVALDAAVAGALAGPAISHRSAVFSRKLAALERELCALVGAERATLLLGSGTLANDVVGGQIAVAGGSGVVVVDGEFGRRLTDHAQRWGLEFDAFERPWGDSWRLAELEAFVDARPGTAWLWATLCETSTGALHDLSALRALCAERGVRLYLDAVSAVGAVPVDLGGVEMATAVSGKALGSYPGVAVVFHPRGVAPQPQRLPRYLDLGLYEASAGVAFTQSSNLVDAFAAAVKRYRTGAPTADIAAMARWLRERLRALGLRILVRDDLSSPAVTTLDLPSTQSSRELGDRLRDAGFLVSYESEYLLARNWLQVCLMGACGWSDLQALVRALERALTGGELQGAEVDGRDPGAAGSRHARATSRRQYL